MPRAGRLGRRRADPGGRGDRARAALDKAQRDLSRAEQLAKKGVSSRSQLDGATSAVRLAEAGVPCLYVCVDWLAQHVVPGFVRAAINRHAPED